MVSTVVLINAEPNKVNQVAQALVGIDGISEVFSVAGRYDLVAILRVQTNEELADLVTEKMLAVPGITSSETLIAFKVFSEYDLENMFRIGIE